MRLTLIAWLTASVLAGLLPMVPATALAQATPGPTLRIDPAQLPALAPVVPMPPRNPRVPIATVAGAAISVLAVDLVTGGMLLTPLGLPAAATILSFGGGAAVAAPAYTLTERLVALVITISAAAGGGYLGAYLAEPHPEFVGLSE
jgi:hypothetical protein